jgi:hypothetical protein
MKFGSLNNFLEFKLNNKIWKWKNDEQCWAGFRSKAGHCGPGPTAKTTRVAWVDRRDAAVSGATVAELTFRLHSKHMDGKEVAAGKITATGTHRGMQLMVRRRKQSVRWFSTVVRGLQWSVVGGGGGGDGEFLQL